MDNSGPRNAADPGQISGAMMEKRIDERSVQIAGSRVNHQPGGFVHHQQVFVLEHDGQRDVLRFIACWRGLRHRNSKGFAAFDLQGRITNRRALRFDCSAANQRLEALARQGRNRCRERTVEPPPEWAASRRTLIV